MNQAYYHSTIEDFLDINVDELIGKLNKAGTSFASQWTITTTSWDSSISILKKSLSELVQNIEACKKWHILFEYEIPRLQSRIDVVIIAADLIFVVEFKYDRGKFELADIRQVEDYANDLKDFHFQSKNRVVIPILLAPLAKSIRLQPYHKNSTIKALRANAVDFSEILYNAYNRNHEDQSNAIDPFKWEQSEYQPTPTIVQAARVLFAGHKVEAITKSDAGVNDLKITTDYLIDKIKEAREGNTKIVCFVTGVPGAGKTLVGLNVVHEKEAFGGKDFDTAYFSGNGPLIKVLREALSRDHYSRHKILYQTKRTVKKPTKGDSEREVKAKIQNLHSFIKDGMRSEKAPAERIVVFDEAQRCWNAEHFYRQGKRNQNREKNPVAIQLKSEAELLFEFMSKHNGWAVIIALVGGGQEINTGEAGISEWGKAIQEKYHDWQVHISPQLLIGDSVTDGKSLFAQKPDNIQPILSDKLHLKVSRRSFRAENLNEWVNAIINNESAKAQKVASFIKSNYPLLITRKIDTAKRWLKSNLTGTKRIGMLASSGGMRLRPYGILTKENIDEAYWFLNDEDDIRSSSFLEIAATEYAVQGLELDWTGICWDADLRRNRDGWDFKNFRGTNWINVGVEEDHQYLLNTYRVLLTRAREGMIIFVPEGEVDDETRLPEFYNPIFEYLKSCGLDEI
ncbi:MAG TPA: hypothetical protein DCQ97_00895 [Chitinophagaceae bacterium]|nr:hypothetical protein [Chitinophagaceae bacterium]